jgi:hypothetical protein
MKLTQNQTISIFGIMLIAAVISTPIIYAAVEPHIILTMDAGQTTAPFTINNNTDYTVFEILPGGEINDSLGIGFRTNNDVVSILVTDDIADPVILKSWALDRSFNSDDPIHIPFSDIVMSGMVKRDSGASSCVMGFAQFDGASWSPTVSIGTSGTSWISSTDLDGESWLFDDTTMFGYIMYNSDSATTCSFKNFQSYGVVVIPIDMPIHRVI